MRWNVRFRGSGFSLLSYVRGGPYSEQDVMPAQAGALLFGQILSLLISITYKTSLMVSQPSMYFWRECGFQIFPSMYPIHELSIENCWNIKSKFNTFSNFYAFASVCRFPVPHWHYSCEKRSWLSGQRSRGTSVQVTRRLIATEKTVAHPWVNYVNTTNNFLAPRKWNYVTILYELQSKNTSNVSWC